MRRLDVRKNEFTTFRDVKIFVGTWNVNGKVPKRIKAWLREDNPSDIYALCFQEMVDLNTVNVVSESESSSRTQAWAERVPKSLKKMYGKEFGLVASKFMVGTSLLVFAESSLLKDIKSVIRTSVATGIGGIVGNKGAVGIRLRFLDSTLCFLSSHFAAHRDNVEARNADFKTISEKMLFTDSVRDQKGVVLYSRRFHIGDHGAVFWAGDFNYRIDSEVDIDTVYAHIERREWKELRAVDQLNQERNANRVFQTFEERDVDFPPTYKFQPGTLKYDRRPEKKMRVPAWCDRVLWKANTTAPTKLNAYESVQLVGSDHMPVRATFATRIRSIDHDRRIDIVKSLCRHCTEWAKKVPRLEAMPSGVAFGTVRFGAKKKRRVRLTNPTSNPIRWSAIGVDAVSWLRVNPSSGLVPARGVSEIIVSVSADAASARAIVAGRDVMSRILLIRPTGGADVHIACAGCLVPSCVNFSLCELLRLSGPVRLSTTTLRWTPKKIVPNELWRLLEELARRGPELVRALDSIKTFTANDVRGCVADDPSVARVFDALDTGKVFDSKMSTTTLAKSLSYFLLLTWHVRVPIPQQRIGMTSRAETDPVSFAEEMLRKLSTEHRHALVYLVLFVRHACPHQEDAAKFASVLSRMLIGSNAIYGNRRTGIAEASDGKSVRILSRIFLHLVEKGRRGGS